MFMSMVAFPFKANMYKPCYQGNLFYSVEFSVKYPLSKTQVRQKKPKNYMTALWFLTIVTACKMLSVMNK